MTSVNSVTPSHARVAPIIALALGILFAHSAVFSAKEDADQKKDTDAEHKVVEAQTDLAPADAYPLDTCIVSGEKLGSMGDPIVKVYDGREIRFCCAECPKKFEMDQAGYSKKLEAAINAQQKPNYPGEVCLVSGEKFGGEMGEPVDYVFGNRYLKLCCKGCIKDLTKEPTKYLPALDTAIIARDMENYPLDTCVVSGDKLGSMGDPVDYVFAGRLVRLCCEKHLGDFLKNPSSYMAKLDEAAKAKSAQ